MARPRNRRRSAPDGSTQSPQSRRLHYEPLEHRRLLAQLTVTTDQDVVDLSDGKTSLREAIFAANFVLGHDEIVFAFGHDDPATIGLTGGELTISDSLTIVGPGAANLRIHSGSAAQEGLFVISDSLATNLLSVGIKGLTMTGAENSAIRSAENLTVSDVVFRSNRGERGGAIRVDHISSSQAPVPNLTVYDSLFVANHAIGGPRNRGVGGAIYFASRKGLLEISGTTFQDNKAEDSGGGIYSGHATDVVITDSTLIDNQAVNGGAIALTGDDSQSATIDNSAIQNNIAVQSGGGIYSGKELIVRNSTISGNRTLTPNVQEFEQYGGAGIAAWDNLTLLDSSVQENHSQGDGGGLTASSSSSRTYVANTSFLNNSAGNKGGGISAVGSFELRRSVIAGNQSGAGGGGGIHTYTDYRSTSTITDSTINHNSTTGDGGGIHAQATSIINSTISGNQAFGFGGGLAIWGYQDKIAHSTITDNTADADRDGHGTGGGVFSGSITINHSLVVGNHAEGGKAHDVAGIYSANFALIGYGAEFLAPLAPNGSQPLADGTPLLTHALLPGSPAIDAGQWDATAGQDGIPQFDQRGQPFYRVGYGAIDLGAYEWRPNFAPYDGDVDFDGDIDGRDLLAWQRSGSDPYLLVGWQQSYGRGAATVTAHLTAATEPPSVSTTVFLDNVVNAGPFAAKEVSRRWNSRAADDTQIPEVPLAMELPIDRAFIDWTPPRWFLSDFGDIATRRYACVLDPDGPVTFTMQLELDLAGTGESR